MKSTPSIDNAITARLKLAGLAPNKRTRGQLTAYLCIQLKVSDHLKSLSDTQVFEICKRPEKEEDK